MVVEAGGLPFLEVVAARPPRATVTIADEPPDPLGCRHVRFTVAFEPGFVFLSGIAAMRTPAFGPTPVDVTVTRQILTPPGEPEQPVLTVATMDLLFAGRQSIDVTLDWPPPPLVPNVPVPTTIVVTADPQNKLGGGPDSASVLRSCLLAD